MKVYELSKELDVTSKVLLEFLRKNGFDGMMSHNQNLSDEMIELATKEFYDDSKPETSDQLEIKAITTPSPEVKTKIFAPDEMIPCRSVTPWKLLLLGIDNRIKYNWNYFGDIEFVAYRDLQSWRKTNALQSPKIVIMNEEIRNMWKNDLGKSYEEYDGIEFPEQYFDLSNDAFYKLIETASQKLKEVLKVTAINMIRHENYPDVMKLKIIDEILGTELSSFI